MRKLRDIDSVRAMLKEAMPLSEVAASLGIELKSSGDNWKGLCPFHVEDTPSFGVSDERGLYHCFGCKAGGDVFKLVEMHETLTHIESIYRVAEIVGTDLSQYEREESPEERQISRYYELNAVRHEYAANETGAKAFKAWAKRRRFSKEVLEQYGVGYSAETGEKPSDDVISQEEYKALGLWRKAQWDNAIVVPLRDAFGRICGFRNRPLEGETKTVGPAESHPVPVTEIYGLHEARRAIREKGFVIMVEGEPDVWQMVSNGYTNTVGMIGTKLNEKMIATLRDLNIRQVVVMPDGDEAGRKFARRLSESWKETDIQLKIAEVMDGDPDEILLKAGPAFIDEALTAARYTFEYIVDATVREHYTGTMTGRVDVMYEMKKYISKATAFQREMMITLLAQKLDVDREALRDYYIETQTEQEQVALHNLRGEKAVLKRMVEDEIFVGEALTTLVGTDFYLAKHKQMFDTIGDLYRRQKDIDVDTVTTAMTNRYGPTAAATIKSVLHVDINADAAESMLEDVKDKSVRRDVQKRAQDVIVRMNDLSSPSKESVQNFSAGLARAIVGTGEAVSESSTLANNQMDVIFERVRNPNLIVGLDLGRELFTLNTALHGLQKKRYAVFAAPSGVGKTAFACAIARRASVDLEVPTSVFTFETGKEALTLRNLSAISGVESDKIVTGFLTPDELAEVQHAAALLGGAPLSITERGRSVEECVALMRSEKLRKDTGLFVIDYIQLMYMADKKSNMPRHEELGHISRMFLEAANELDASVLVLAQMNREAAKTGNQQGENMGESYKIKQDADIVITAREKTKDEEAQDGPEKGNRIFLLDKNRHGRQGIYWNVMADLSVMRMHEVGR